MSEQIINLLKECKIQLEYLNQKFQETGTTNALISKLNLAIFQEEFREIKDRDTCIKRNMTVYNSARNIVLYTGLNGEIERLDFEYDYIQHPTQPNCKPEVRHFNTSPECIEDVEFIQEVLVYLKSIGKSIERRKLDLTF